MSRDNDSLQSGRGVSVLDLAWSIRMHRWSFSQLSHRYHSVWILLSQWVGRALDKDHTWLEADLESTQRFAIAQPRTAYGMLCSGLKRIPGKKKKKTAVNQLGVAETTAVLDWCSQETGCALCRVHRQRAVLHPCLLLNLKHSRREWKQQSRT